MITVGLTGGLASGKSLVSGIFREFGAVVIDADVISREVIMAGKPGYYEVVEAFGNEILENDGSINRKKLAEIVFNDKKKLKLLESIIHPKVMAEQERLLQNFRLLGSISIAVVDAPLLIEAGFHKKVDYLIVVSAKKDNQIKRSLKRDKISIKEIEKRIDAQFPLEKKIKLADFVIENNGTISEAREQVIALIERLKGGIKN